MTLKQWIQFPMFWHSGVVSMHTCFHSGHHYLMKAERFCEINASEVSIASRKGIIPFSSTHTFPAQEPSLLYKPDVSLVWEGCLFLFFIINTGEGLFGGLWKILCLKKKKSFSYFIYSFSGLQATTAERGNDNTAFLSHTFILTQHIHDMQF